MADARTAQLGGMAFRNGVLAIGPTHWAVAVRTEDGSIETTVRPRPRGGDTLAQRIPLVRGPVRLANMLRVLPAVRRAVPSARFAFESPGSVAAMLLSGSATRALRAGASEDSAIGEIAAATVSLGSTIGSMRLGDVAEYHGAEHKAIRAWELGIEPAAAPRRHPRCGTNLAVPMLVFGAIATQVLRLAMPRHGREARIGGQLLGMALATELFRAGQRPESAPALARAAERVGLVVQGLTTAEPSAAQLAVGTAAVDALLAVEGLPPRKNDGEAPTEVGPPRV